MANPQAVAFKEGFIQTNGHGRMHYHEAGPLGSGAETLILIHTNGGSAYQYAGTLAMLSKKFRVIAWEMPGHGDSDPLSRHYTIEDYCAALAAFMDALGIKAAHISGCSCGGSISVGFASLYHTRTLSTVIVETPMRNFDEWGARWSHTEANFGIPTQSAEEVQQRINTVNDAVLARWNIDRNKAGGKLLVSVMWAMRQFDTEGNVKNIRCPAMILYGAKGPTISMKDRYAKAVPGIAIKTVDNCGHFPMLDEPEAFAATLAEFCSAAGKR
jgi:pimeloyl-ACP methyl ester carboxylesterase